jgi:hypothetical protein
MCIIANKYAKYDSVFINVKMGENRIISLPVSLM